MGKSSAFSFTLDSEQYRHVIRWMSHLPPRTVSQHIADVLDKHVRSEPTMATIVELMERQNELLQSINTRLKRLEELGIQVGGNVLPNVPRTETLFVETKKITDALDNLGRD